MKFVQFKIIQDLSCIATNQNAEIDPQNAKFKNKLCRAEKGTISHTSWQKHHMNHVAASESLRI